MGNPFSNESAVKSDKLIDSNMSHTQSLQFEFARHIRNPSTNRRPTDIADRRMSIYRDLFYKNIESFISNGFPVLRNIMGDEQWHLMIREFMDVHRCKTPYFPEISEEFLEYLQLERTSRESDLPFMVELAHYEWVELALDISPLEIPQDRIRSEQIESEPKPRASIEEQISQQTLSLSPLAWNLTYQWPVHRLSPTFQLEQMPDTPTYLLVYRNRSDQVKFMEMNPVTARLVSIIKESEMTGHKLLAQLQQELRELAQPEAVHRGGMDTLFHLYEVDVLLLSH